MGYNCVCCASHSAPLHLKGRSGEEGRTSMMTRSHQTHMRARTHARKPGRARARIQARAHTHTHTHTERERDKHKFLLHIFRKKMQQF